MFEMNFPLYLRHTRYVGQESDESSYTGIRLNPELTRGVEMLQRAIICA